MRFLTFTSLIIVSIAALCCHRIYFREQFTITPDDWVLYGGNIEHTNVAKSIVKPPFTTVWEYDASAGFSYATGAVADSVLFMTNLIGEVHAVSINTGKGSRIQDFGTAIIGMPIIENNKMYIALTQSDESLIAYNLISRKIEWRVACGDVETTPLLINDRLYVPTLDGKLTCVDKRNGKIIWTYIVPRKKLTPAIHSSPASDGELIVFGCDDKNIYAIRSIDGQLQWSAKTNRSILASPSISNKKVFVGSLDSTFYAFDIETGEQVWNKMLGAKILSSQAINDNRIYVGTAGGTVYCLDSESGTTIWQAKTNGTINTPPVISDSIVYFGCMDKTLYAYDISNGDLLEAYKTEGRIKTQPAISKQHIFLFVEDRSVIALKHAGDK